jgi:hypothetical protein
MGGVATGLERIEQGQTRTGGQLQGEASQAEAFSAEVRLVGVPHVNCQSRQVPGWHRTLTLMPAATTCMGLYQSIWEYDAKTLARDLSAHLACGTGTGAAFWLLTTIR